MQSTEKDQLFMGLAIELAHTAYENDEVPVGAVIVQRRNSEVLSAFSNQMRATKKFLQNIKKHQENINLCLDNYLERLFIYLRKYIDQI